MKSFEDIEWQDPDEQAAVESAADPVVPPLPALEALSPLRVHSHYSLLRSTVDIDGLLERAAAAGLQQLALTDYASLYGAVSFGRACSGAGIRPITGLTLPIVPPRDEGLNLGAAADLVLLADGPAGYRSLCRLSSLLQGAADRERRLARGLDWESLKANSQGLICLSGGRSGWIERYLRAGSEKAAGRFISRLAGIFGEDTVLSLELHRPEDIVVAHQIQQLGHRFGLATAAVQPVYTLQPADVPRLKLLAAIEKNMTLAELAGQPQQPPGGAIHWQSPAEIMDRFADFPAESAQTAAIAARCRPALPDGRPIWPVLKLPAGQSPEQALQEQAQAGLEVRYSDPPPKAQARLEKELAAIGRSGYAPLFIIVADIVRFARRQEIPVSTRGSVANSLVAYCTGITTVDPLAHDLLFERFLNPARANPPDIDLDFCSRRRDEVLAYVRQSYGPEQVALVATISTMQPKSAVRETAKAHGLEGKVIDRLARRLPRQWHPDPRRREKKSLEDVLEGLEDARQREVVSAAFHLIGQPHHLSVHPGGLVITPGPLTDHVPVQWAPKGFLITQFDHRDIEALGLPKLDLLGIRALTVLADTVEWVNVYHQANLKLDAIPLNDEKTAGLLTRAETVGVFQCESTGARRTLRQLKVKDIPDLAVANAFFKPGPATGGMAQSFIRRYRGEEKMTFLHPALEPILGSTQGVLLFQEQILRVATEIAGLSWSQADHLRRGMSRFRYDEMAAMQADFVNGCCRPAPEGPGFATEEANTLWEQVLAFAGYGFNRGHATAYADVSYRSAYLKAHWPAEFLCARLADWGGFHHPAVYMAEARQLGIVVRPPHINFSRRAFTLTYEPTEPAGRLAPVLWMGLGQVRDLRRESVKAIVRERDISPFRTLNDLLRRVQLQKKEIAHLIQCGALDGLAGSRSALLAEAAQVQRAGGVGQLAFAFATPEAAVESAAQRLTWEQQILGQPVSIRPVDLLGPRAARLTPLGQLPGQAGRTVQVAGFRLPGWTGGSGFYLSDGDGFITVRAPKGLPAGRAWQILAIRGVWKWAEWGGGWLQASQIEPIPLDTA